MTTSTERRHRQNARDPIGADKRKKKDRERKAAVRVEPHERAEFDAVANEFWNNWKLWRECVGWVAHQDGKFGDVLSAEFLKMAQEEKADGNNQGAARFRQLAKLAKVPWGDPSRSPASEEERREVLTQLREHRERWTTALRFAHDSLSKKQFEKWALRYGFPPLALAALVSPLQGDTPKWRETGETFEEHCRAIAAARGVELEEVQLADLGVLDAEYRAKAEAARTRHVEQQRRDAEARTADVDISYTSDEGHLQVDSLPRGEDERDD
jgi:hypothetical protein